VAYFKDECSLEQVTEILLKLQDKPKKSWLAEDDTCCSSKPNKRLSKE
jgi:hypothetical protein